MATTVDVDADPFHDPGVKFVVLALVLVAMLTLIGLAVVYYGDSLADPSWSERSVPPAQLY